MRWKSTHLLSLCQVLALGWPPVTYLLLLLLEAEVQSVQPLRSELGPARHDVISQSLPEYLKHLDVRSPSYWANSPECIGVAAMLRAVPLCMQLVLCSVGTHD